MVKERGLDSVILWLPPGSPEPETGASIGELTDEYPKDDITHFAAAGPKTYALRYT